MVVTTSFLLAVLKLKSNEHPTTALANGKKQDSWSPKIKSRGEIIS